MKTTKKPSQNDMIESCLVGYALTIHQALEATTPEQRQRVMEKAEQNRRNMEAMLDQYARLK